MEPIRYQFYNNVMVLLILTDNSSQTVSTIHSFFLAMTLYPEVQKKAQAEIDEVIGPDRLPTLDDWESLPYVAALCTEVFRWHPIAPLCTCL